MTFILQQPGTAKLLEAIDAAALNANSGGGVFAFASKGGIDAFFARPNISIMLTHQHPFHLIVGIDAITNADALLCLGEKLEQFPDVLTVDVFYHANPNSIFHPKFSWFRQRNNLRLVTGSGNLTLRGLGQISTNNLPSGNWEAFSVQSLVGAGATATNQQIDDWVTEQRNAGTLCSLDDERIRDRAMSNGRVRFLSVPAAIQQSTPSDIPAPVANAVPVDGIDLGTPEVLVREIPRNRTGQADVGKGALMEFFGYDGIAKNVYIQHVSIDNTLGPVDSIRLFVNESDNYRLELRAIAELEYVVDEDDNRMILVATKLDRRSFRYTILPVTAHDYDHVVALLGPFSHGRRLMREVRVSPDNLRNAWPGAPTNLLPVDLLTPEP